MYTNEALMYNYEYDYYTIMTKLRLRLMSTLHNEMWKIGIDSVDLGP